MRLSPWQGGPRSIQGTSFLKHRRRGSAVTNLSLVSWIINVVGVSIIRKIWKLIVVLVSCCALFPQKIIFQSEPLLIVLRLMENLLVHWSDGHTLLTGALLCPTHCLVSMCVMMIMSRVNIMAMGLTMSWNMCRCQPMSCSALNTIEHPGSCIYWYYETKL